MNLLSRNSFNGYHPVEIIHDEEVLDWIVKNSKTKLISIFV